MRTYQELRLEERIEIQRRREAGDSLRCIARSLGRAASTIRRECQRGDGESAVYRAQRAHAHARARCRCGRVPRKLADPALWQVVQELLATRWSPQQIAGILRDAFPDDQSLRVSHETIYTAIYLTPRGELCKPPTRGTDRRGKIPDMQSIHVRPADVEDRLIPGHWEGDLVKGAG